METLTATKKAYKIGRGLVVGIPKEIANALDIKEQSVIEITIKNTGNIGEKKIRKKNENPEPDTERPIL